MAGQMLSSFQAIDKALAAGWKLFIRGATNNHNLVIVQVHKPNQAAAWTTIYSTGGALDALNRTGETLREVISG